MWGRVGGGLFLDTKGHMVRGRESEIPKDRHTQAKREPLGMRVCFVYGAPSALGVVVDFPLQWVTCEASGVKGLRAVDTVEKVEGIYDPVRLFFHPSNALSHRIISQALCADRLLTMLHTEARYADTPMDAVERLFYEGLMTGAAGREDCGAGGGAPHPVWHPLVLPGRLGWNVVAVESVHA